MESTAVLVENDYPIEELQKNLLDSRESKLNPKQEEKPELEVQEKKKEDPKPKAGGRKFVFRKGESVFEVDEDAEFEFTADKKPMRMTLKELRDRAAGDVAVKNRMHAIAEERKKIQATFKEFARIAGEDPLAALEYISERAKEADTEFEYQKYLEKLADQADKLSKMDEKERKALELEKKLNKANQDLSQKEREKEVYERKAEILSQYPEIGDQRFDEMVEAVLADEALLEGCESEMDVINTVEDLIEETVAQRDIMKAIEKVDPSYVEDNELIFLISDQLKQNPDLNEDDLEEIVRDVLGTPKRTRHVEVEEREPQNAHRAAAARKLSEKQRSTMSKDHLRTQGSSDFHILAAELKKKKEEETQYKKSNKLRR